MGVMIFWCKQCDLQEKLPGRFVSASFSTQVPWMKENCRIVLASSSPRRQEILSLLGEPPKKNEDKTTNVCSASLFQAYLLRWLHPSLPKLASESGRVYESLWSEDGDFWKSFFWGCTAKIVQSKDLDKSEYTPPGKLGLQGENAVGFPWYPHEVDQVRQ